MKHALIIGVVMLALAGALVELVRGRRPLLVASYA
jgi:hypothetical protein